MTSVTTPQERVLPFLASPAAPVQAPARRKRSGRLLLITGVLLALGGGGWFAFGGSQHGAGVAALQTSPVTRQTLRSRIRATGLVRAQIGAEVKVGARISGQVQQLLANVGDVVRQGQPIARIDDRDLSAQLARAESDLAAATAQVAIVRRGARPEEIAQGEAALALAEAEQRLATQEAQRQSGLFAEGFVSSSERDRAVRDREVAQARAASARSALELLRHRFLPEDLALAEARRQQAEAAVASARVQRSYATIEAPIPGVVAAVATQEGETVSAGLNSPTFVTIIDLERLEVAAYVDEVDVGRVQVGQAASFTVDSFPEVEFTGRVTAIYPRALIQSNVVNYITTLSIDNAEGRLKPDMTATVDISLQERPGVLTVPDRALRRAAGQRVVEVLEQGRRQERPVRVGIRGGGHTEILSGLREGERVITGEGGAPGGAER